jgi:hypothetical protein
MIHVSVGFAGLSDNLDEASEFLFFSSASTSLMSNSVLAYVLEASAPDLATCR